jgi:nicotinate-nucleotide adenylyltransferase
MGGTFDPIHVGHLIIAEQVREQLHQDSVLFMPTGQPPHKPGRARSPAEDRYAMTVLATEGNPRFSVSRLEIERPGPSYALDTIRALRAESGADTDLTFILGADQALELMTWHRAAEVVRETRFVTVPRPGYDLGLLPQRLGPAAERVQVLPLRELAISASDIRARATAGLSLRYLVPEPARQYILTHGLYRAATAQCRSQEPSSPP